MNRKIIKQKKSMNPMKKKRQQTVILTVVNKFNQVKGRNQ